MLANLAKCIRCISLPSYHTLLLLFNWCTLIFGGQPIHFLLMGIGILFTSQMTLLDTHGSFHSKPSHMPIQCLTNSIPFQKNNLTLTSSVFKLIGGEYRSLAHLLTKLGIQFRHPCLHTHQQNAQAERKYLHIIEMGLSMLAQANLHLKFQQDAFSSAVFVINTLPTHVLYFHSPYQLLFGHTPDYSFLKVFCYSYFPYLYPYNHHNL